MIIDMRRDIYITTADEARDFLCAHGIDDYQHEEFALLLRFGDVADVEFELEDLRDAVKHDERYQDALYTALIDALNFTDDMLRKARTKEARQLLQAVKDKIEHSEVF